MTVLAVVAHPDDADIFCGGTLAKHAARGESVVVANMTCGEFGATAGSEADIADVREAEARAAGEVLGVDEVRFLGYEDGRIAYSIADRFAMTDLLREVRPDTVVTHYWEDPHPDHRATGRLVGDAQYMAPLPLAETEHDPHQPDNVYFFGKPRAGFEPEVFVDVTAQMATKAAAIEAHESQLQFLDDHEDDGAFGGLVDSIRAENHHLGRQVGCRFAEGFVALERRPREFLD